jgi:hypothetical protein
MRATFLQGRFRRAAVGLVVGVTALAITAPAYAAVPTATVNDEALPTQFSAGADVGYRSTYVFTDGSSLSKLFLVFNTTGTATNNYLAVTRNGANAVKSCVMGTPVTCTFKTVRTNETFVVTAGFTVADGVTSTTGQAVWSATGATSSDGGTSHGDTWTDPDYTLPNPPLTSTQSTDANFGGGFSAADGGSVQNGQAVTALNRQATKLLGLPAGVGATVSDGSPTGHDCGTIDCSTAFGEWSDVTVGDGQSFGSPFRIVITYYQGNPKGFVHQYVQDGVTKYEPVPACPKKNPAAAAPCFVWTANLNQATIYTLHNGSWKGL